MMSLLSGTLIVGSLPSVRSTTSVLPLLAWISGATP